MSYRKRLGSKEKAETVPYKLNSGEIIKLPTKGHLTICGN